MARHEIERTFPAYYLEHRERYARSRVIPVEGRPIWVLQSPGGFSVNSIVIEGGDGLIVFDTGVCHEQGQAIAEAIRSLSDAPIRAIIYSHHHVDHCQGTDALVTHEDVASGRVRVIAWESFEREYRDENQVVGPIMGLRAAYQYGYLLPPEELAYTGLGPQFLGGTLGRFVPPTETLSEETALEIAGVRLVLFRSGGEAASEMGCYLPDFRTAIVADEVYVALANLYTLRGAKFRDAMRWAGASDRVLRWDVEVLLGCHMPPVVGEDAIRRVLTTYRDAIQLQHDQSVRHILRGATPEELRTGLVELPEWLDLDPYTRPMYGTASGNAAEQFVGYLGWFGGDATELRPTPRPERSRRLVQLMGGRERVLAQAEEALADDPQWTAELASLVTSAAPDDEDARALKAAGLRSLGYRELNPLRRNWYLTGALELEGGFDLEVIQRAGRALLFGPAQPLAVFANLLRFAVDPDRTGDRHVRVRLALDDSGESTVLELRNGVLIAHEDGEVDAEVCTGREALSLLCRGEASYTELLERDRLTVQGDPEAAAAFFAAFDLEPHAVALHAR